MYCKVPILCKFSVLRTFHCGWWVILRDLTSTDKKDNRIIITSHQWEPPQLKKFLQALKISTLKASGLKQRKQRYLSNCENANFSLENYQYLLEFSKRLQQILSKHTKWLLINKNLHICTHPEISWHGNLKAVLNLQAAGMFTLEPRISECWCCKLQHFFFHVSDLNLMKKLISDRVASGDDISFFAHKCLILFRI